MPSNIGSQADTAVTDSTAAGSVTALLKGMLSLLGGGTGTEVVQPTHDDLNCNANVQVSDADASLANPLPSSDAGPAWTPAFGVSSARVTSADASSGADITDAPASGKKIVITDVIVSVDTEMTVDIEEETSGTTVLSFYMAANTTVQITPRTPIKLATADKKLRVDTDAAGNIAVTVCYYSEA